MAFKIIGFMIIIAGLIWLLMLPPAAKPSDSLATTTPQAADPFAAAMRTATALDKEQPAAEDDSFTTQYAEGYDSTSFGSAFDDPNEGITKAELQAPPEGTWKTLLKLRFDVKYDERIDDIVFQPIFTDDIRALEGKEITLKGYILPHDITQMGGNPNKAKNDGSMFIFSAFPAATCFYCGGAGPESVVEVLPSKAIPYNKNIVSIKGKLELNATDFLRLSYRLTNARLVE